MSKPLKYYRFNAFFLDKDLPILVMENGDERDLENKVWLLLLLFCQHPKQVISRERIVANVYDGVVVSDNAVNKLVAKARKLLTDSSTKPQYIKTIPKQGYSFVAEIVEVASTPEINAISGHGLEPTKEVDTNTEPPAGYPANNTAKIWFYIALCITLVVVIVTLFNNHLFEQTSDYFVNKKLSPLTSAVGVETSPHLSANGQFLIYQKSSPQDQTSGWWIKGTAVNQIERSLPIDNLHSPIAWSGIDSAFLYIDRKERCEVRRMSVSNELLNSSPVMDCDNYIIAQLIYSENEKGFYFIGKKEQTEPWKIYHFDFQGNEVNAINQPTVLGIGNYAIDLSPDKTKLLILSAKDSQSTLLHVFDIKNQNVSLLGSREWFLNRALWHHDSERIVHTPQYYARELLISNLQGNQSSTLISTSKRVLENFLRHPNGMDYYFTSFQMDNDLVHLSGSNNILKNVDNSELYEKMPTFSKDTDSWFFISNRSGKSQIYLSSSKSKSSKQVSFFNEEHQFTSLAASMNGRLLAFHDRNFLNIYEPNAQTFESYRAPNGNIIASSWLGNDKVLVSVAVDSSTEVYSFDLKAQRFDKLAHNWSVVFTGDDPSEIYAVEKTSHQLFQLDGNFNAIKAISLVIDNPIAHTGLQVKATSGSIVYLKNNGLFSTINRFDLISEKSTEIGKWLYVAGFDVKGEHLIFSYEKNRTGDVMRSHLQPIN